MVSVTEKSIYRQSKYTFRTLSSVQNITRIQGHLVVLRVFGPPLSKDAVLKPPPFMITFNFQSQKKLQLVIYLSSE